MDKIYIAHVWQYVDTIMANFNKLFNKLSLRQNWNKNKYSRREYFNEGIYNLCTKECRSLIIAKRFEEVVKREAQNGTSVH